MFTLLIIDQSLKNMFEKGSKMGTSSEIMHIWKEYRIFILHLLLNFWFDVKYHTQHPWSVYTEFYKISISCIPTKHHNIPNKKNMIGSESRYCVSAAIFRDLAL